MLVTMKKQALFIIVLSFLCGMVYSENTEDIYYMGQVGLNVTDPTQRLDVNGTFKNNYSGLFTVMAGNDDDVADVTAGGLPNRGIRLWSWSDAIENSSNSRLLLLFLSSREKDVV